MRGPLLLFNRSAKIPPSLNTPLVGLGRSIITSHRKILSAPRVVALFIALAVIPLVAGFAYTATICGAVGALPPTTGSYITDAAPVLSSSVTEIVLTKDLRGYGGYSADGAVDVLYTNQSATWTFPLPSDIDINGIAGAYFRVSQIADDHGSPTVASNYITSVWTNGTLTVGACSAGVPHGADSGRSYATVYVWGSLRCRRRTAAQLEELSAFTSSGLRAPR